MSASITDMRDFVLALERAVPWGLHPTTDKAIHDWLAEARSAAGEPAVVWELVGRICQRVVQESQFSAENDGGVVFYCDAYRPPRQAERFAARFGQTCAPIRMVST
jgi:hypothetical protein